MRGRYDIAHAPFAEHTLDLVFGRKDVANLKHDGRMYHETRADSPASSLARARLRRVERLLAGQGAAREAAVRRASASARALALAGYAGVPEPPRTQSLLSEHSQRWVDVLHFEKPKVPAQWGSAVHSQTWVPALQIVPPCLGEQPSGLQGATHAPSLHDALLSAQTLAVPELPKRFTSTESGRKMSVAQFQASALKAHQPTPSTSIQVSPVVRGSQSLSSWQSSGPHPLEVAMHEVSVVHSTHRCVSGLQLKLPNSTTQSAAVVQVSAHFLGFAGASEACASVASDAASTAPSGLPFASPVLLTSLTAASEPPVPPLPALASEPPLPASMFVPPVPASTSIRRCPLLGRRSPRSRRFRSTSRRYHPSRRCPHAPRIQRAHRCRFAPVHRGIIPSAAREGQPRYK